SEIESALTAMHSSLSGRLPVLDGFSNAANHPLDQYQRGFFQAAAKITSAPSGGFVVRIQTKITAWYPASDASKSGYQLLSSNGRIESDILDQLAERLNAKVSSAAPPASATANKDRVNLAAGKTFPDAAKRFSIDLASAPASEPAGTLKPDKSLQKE